MADKEIFFIFSVGLALSGFLISERGLVSKCMGVLILVPFIVFYWLSRNVDGIPRANAAAIIGLMFVASGFARVLPRPLFIIALLTPYILVFLLNYFDLKML